ncbi:MAG: ribonuclease H-like domain-containing protein [Candidatus Aminicenantes bacterium]|nr:ribonuclease H-like domain-containing protein [Candidatus Aminicenantes bacterium]
MTEGKIKIFCNGRDIEEQRKNSVRRISTFLVFDVETVPDTEMVEFAGKDKDKEKLECLRAEQDGRPAAQNAFLQPHFHRIVAVSTLIIKPSEGGEGAHGFSLSLVSAYGSEAGLVKHFWQRFRKAMIIGKSKEEEGDPIKINIHAFPCLVSFNGKNFDMPVIISRTLKHSESLEDSDRMRIAFYHDDYDTWENQSTNYRHRFTKYHMDLCWDLTGSNISLAAACHLAGIPVKTGMDGKDVWKAYQEGRQREITEYCAEDVVATAQLFSVWNEVFLGKRFDFPTREELSGLTPKIVNLGEQSQ